MANKPAGMFGKGGGDEFGGLGEILSLLVELKGGGKEPLKTAGYGKIADPSGAPIGEATATAGVQTNIKQAPIPVGAPPPDKGSFLSERGVDSSRFSLDNASSPGPDTGGFSLQTVAPSSTGPTAADQGGGLGDFGGMGTYTMAGAAIGSVVPGIGTAIGAAVGAVADIGMAIAGAASEEDTTLADRLNEQTFKIRANFKKAQEDYFLPLQIDAKRYAGEQMGKGSDQYEYATTALKGYIEGTAGVLGGQKEWDDVWQDIGGDLEEVDAPPDTWMEFYNQNYEEYKPNTVLEETVGGILAATFGTGGLPDVVIKRFASELTRMGSAMLGASRDMRQQGGGGYRGSV
jgi:hypothetical protein